MIEPYTELNVETPPGRHGEPAGVVSKLLWLLLLAAAASVLGYFIFHGIQDRRRAESTLVRNAKQSAILTVDVIHPKRGAQMDELVLPGNMEAFTDTPVYARTNGYVKRWYTDIGARVKAGQLLAEIEAPELDQQVREAGAALQQAQAALEQARATYEQGRTNEELDRVTAQRWSNLEVKGVVSRQENDQYQAQYQAQLATVRALEKAIAAAQSSVSSAEANLARLRELQNYKLVKAPFDGIITARNTDLGALVNAGNGGPAQELFHMAATGRLRVFVRVPQVYSHSAAPGATMEMTLAELPGRRFPVRIVRTSGAIDRDMRTLLVEADVENPTGLFFPGAFVEVHVKLPGLLNAATVPVNALLFRKEGMSVALVRGGRVFLQAVSIGQDYGDRLEVTSGLSPDEQVIVNPPDSLVAGQLVRVAQEAQP